MQNQDNNNNNSRSKKAAFPKIDKKKVVKFQLVDRSIEDPLSNDPNAAPKVLVPIYIGSEVRKEMFDKINKDIQQDYTPKENSSTANMPKSTKQGIGAQYNKYFGVDIDDGEDYTRFFKAIDEEADDGVFIAPDGSVHDLKKREITDIDCLVNKFGIDRDVFGTEADPTLPKLVEDSEYVLENDVDPEIFTAMDDDDAEPLDDDFFAKALALEDEDDDDQAIDIQPGVKKSTAKSYVSAAPSHLSHISHRSEAMDFVEEKVDHLLKTFYNDEEEEELEEDEEEDGEGVDWDDVIDDFNKFNDPLKYMDNQPLHDKKVNPNLVLTENDDENIKKDEEEEKKEPKEKWDCESILDTYSTTDNIPCKIKEDNIPKKKKKQPKNAEEDEDQKIVPPDMMPKEGETKEEAKARKKAIKEYNRQRRQSKKETKQKFQKATKKVKKSIAASGGSRGHSIIPLD